MDENALKNVLEAEKEKQRQAERQQKKERQKAAEKRREQAESEWKKAKPAKHHIHLESKQIKPCGTRVDEKARLLIPAKDSAGKVHALYRIGTDGKGRFFNKEGVAGNFFSIGNQKDGPLYITICFESAATVREATGAPVVATLTPDNLETVTAAIRERQPDREIVVAGDNDHRTPGTPGTIKAKNAARLHKCRVAIPENINGNTFNDLAGEKGIEEVKQQLETARSATTPPPDELPDIRCNDIELSEIRRLSWAAINAKNDPPILFDSAVGLARVEENQTTGNLELVPCSSIAIRNVLSRAATWHVMKTRKGGIVRETCFPSKALAEDLTVDPNPPLPFLRRIAEAPFFTHNGALHIKPGYSKASMSIYIDSGCKVSIVPETPTGDDLTKARELLDELLFDFPFASDAEKANAIALALLPFAREMIDGPTPVHLIEAPTPGTGKSLLVTVLCMLSLKHVPAMMSEGRDDDEWRKRITAKLMSNPPYIIIDNVKRKLDSGALAAAVATTEWEDRLLGQTKMVKFPVISGWIATANNPQLSAELARRSVRIRLDRKMDRPWAMAPEAFRHANIKEWTRQNRGNLIWAALVIIRHWIRQGRPDPKVKPLGTFESWTRVIGGILESAEIPHFLGNLDEFYEAADAEGAQLRALVYAWWEKWREIEVGASDIFEMLQEATGVEVDLGRGSERSQKTRLGNLLKSIRDRRFDIGSDDAPLNVQVVSAGRYKRAQLWKLRQIGREIIEI